VLGDRPIELTMKRAWACMGPNERGALLVAALGLLLNIRVRHTQHTSLFTQPG
jgi:pheromone shutdown protein TraB